MPLATMRKNLAGPKVFISLLRKNQEIMEVNEPPLKHKGLRMILTLKWWGNLKNFKLQLPLLQRKESEWLMRLHFFWRNKGERQTGNHQRKYLRDWRKQSIADKSLSSVMTLLKKITSWLGLLSPKNQDQYLSVRNTFFKVVKNQQWRDSALLQLICTTFQMQILAYEIEFFLTQPGGMTNW